MRPLKDNIQSLTTQKDGLLAEKTALKNEVHLTINRYFAMALLGLAILHNW